MGGQNYDIAMDQAELLAILLETLLYGVSLFMFAVTVCVLHWKRSTHRTNLKMLAVACGLFITSTAHFVIHMIRVVEGLILYRDTYPGGPTAYFADVAQWSFVDMCYLYAIQTAIGDGVILYRCYAVWQSKLVMILPVLLWAAVSVIGVAIPYISSRGAQNEVFCKALEPWISSFWAVELTTSIFMTGLLAYRIWSVDQRTARLSGHRESHLRPILHIIIDAGAIYSVTLFVAMICFESRSNGQYVILDMITPIISITFYMVIIRVGLTGQGSGGTSLTCGQLTSGTTSSGQWNTVSSAERERRKKMQIHVAHFTESKTERSDRHIALMHPESSIGSSNEVKFDDLGEAV